ncbi:hypothetical protein BaOVIS_010770 [Babesia ovis]|uniref:Uncharacterized protein n=1 Tax=Babesia ovis TaxID=5869 RepID=A0A9W5TBH1_BABOV|nr:hypothetical protein BaOVIS_010770 [Babesia ovis]
MLSKQSLFRLVKDALRRRSLRSFEQIQDSFDYHLKLSLTLIREPSRIHPRKLENGQSYSESRFHDENNPPGGCKKDLHIGFVGSDNLDVDCLRPYEIVMGFQLLAMNCSIGDPLTNNYACRQKLEERLCALLYLAWYNMEQFDFVKLTLLMNSFVNVIHSGFLDAKNFVLSSDNDSSVIKSPDIRAPKCMQASGLFCSTKLLGNEQLDRAFKRFHKSASWRVIETLNMVLTSGADAPVTKTQEGSIDAHSICMMLKYYATIRDIDLTIVCLLWYWMHNQTHLSLGDKFNMVISLSKLENMYLYKPMKTIEVLSRNAAEIEKSVSDSAFLPETKPMDDVASKALGVVDVAGNRNLMDLILSRLVDIEATGNVNMRIFRLYLGAILSFRNCGVELELLRHMAHLTLDDAASIICFEKQPTVQWFKTYAELLYTIQICMGVAKILSPKAVQRVFLDNQVQNITHVSLLNMAKTPSKAPISALGDLCNFVKAMSKQKCLGSDDVHALARLQHTLNEVITIVYTNCSEDFRVKDILAMSDHLYDNNRIKDGGQGRLVRIYAVMNTDHGSKNIMDMYRELYELIVSFYRANRLIGHNLHQQIASVVSATFNVVTAEELATVIRFLQVLARLVKNNGKLVALYDFESIWSHIFLQRDWKDHVVELVDMMYSLLPHCLPWVTQQPMGTNIECMMEHYYNSTVLSRIRQNDAANYVDNPMVPEANRPHLNVTVFAKYTHLAWSLRETSAFMEDLWRHHADVVLNSITAFKNATVLDPPKLEKWGIEISKVNKRSDWWQAFSVHLVVSILLQMHVDSMPSEGMKECAMSRKIHVISFLCRELSDILDVIEDNGASKRQLAKLLAENSKYLAECPHANKLLTRLVTIQSCHDTSDTLSSVDALV